MNFLSAGGICALEPTSTTYRSGPTVLKVVTEESTASASANVGPL